ncbi:uncharacterized protein LOC131233278 isoform X2 [Magnolia sinica]|uniref:uncharacterized protein LOC131233278 isoform X2 n=1 Tax=Magnolia sinica TaxID=86752 RepID=UPI002658493F|nr:uncharacterized protein LOC131233278 isoform X2 [Magnolia sinica]XP_058085934.1 uncharacterized protein LOC131233278 isoform X2 [Magnolia sinica]
MEEKPSLSHRKRPLSEDDDDEPLQPPTEKRPRFPKGKKVKKDDGISAPELAEVHPSGWTDPRLAAKERAKRRNQITAELFSEQGAGILQDVSSAEVNYEGNGNFEDDGILIEPFNLKQEREEGYFDADGNFVEYVNQNEIKDAWLDSVDVDTKLADKRYKKTDKEGEEFQDLSSEDIGKMKRRIANLLQPSETVLQALRRLKGISNDKKGRMPEETKRMFDQLTEDAMKLMENGDYNVYHEKQEVFEREAEGYERLARAREGTSMSAGDSFDMFGEDDENAALNQPSDADGLGSQSGPESSVPSQNVESEVTTIAAVRGTTTTLHQGYTAVPHQENGSHLMSKRVHMMKSPGRLHQMLTKEGTCPSKLGCNFFFLKSNHRGGCTRCELKKGHAQDFVRSKKFIVT